MSDAAEVGLGGDRVRARDRRLDQLVGESEVMVSLRQALPRIARADGSVLIQGPSGTGKELAARLVHDLSRRSPGPFVPVDCGSLAEGILESELFGHARGSFTGAGVERPGLFEQADGGTLFLDEIANTTLGFQAKLLRVLEDGEVRRVGSNHSKQVDVRVVAATNRNLEVDALAGSFRADLLYRLDVLGLRMPPLAERRDDIPLLVERMLVAIDLRTGRLFDLTPEAMAALIAHDWPGNVRELRNVIERATALATGEDIDLEHLPERLRPPSRQLHARQLDELLASCERTLILQRLESNRWNRTRTAAELGITRRGLFNKILRHELSPPARAKAAGA